MVHLELITLNAPIFAFGPIETLCEITQPIPILAEGEIKAVGHRVVHGGEKY